MIASIDAVTAVIVQQNKKRVIDAECREQTSMRAIIGVMISHVRKRAMYAGETHNSARYRESGIQRPENFFGKNAQCV